MNNETYQFLAADGKTYSATLEEIREWYEDNRIGPDDYLTDEVLGHQITVGDLLGVGQSFPAPTGSGKPPVQARENGLNPLPYIDNHLTKAIISTVCIGCMPLGIVAIVYAAQVDGYVKRGDYQLAQDAADTANMWANRSLWIGAAEIFVYAILKLMQAA